MKGFFVSHQNLLFPCWETFCTSGIIVLQELQEILTKDTALQALSVE